MIAVDPKIDYVFKRLFGAVELSALLVNLINAALSLIGDEAVEQVEILNPFVPGEHIDEKLAILDVRARDRRGRGFMVEMQVHAFRAFPERILYYWAGAYREQLSEGENYQRLRPIYAICVLNFVLLEDIATWRQRFVLMDAHTSQRFSDQLEVHTLELPKFQLRVEEIRTDLDRWAWFLRHAEELDSTALPAALQQPAIQKATEVLETMSLDVQERLRAEARRKALLDYNQMMLEARAAGEANGFDKGEKVGFDKGEKAGFDRGHLLGRIETICRLKQIAPPDPAQLATMELPALAALAEQLETGASG